MSHRGPGATKVVPLEASWTSAGTRLGLKSWKPLSLKFSVDEFSPSLFECQRGLKPKVYFPLVK